MPRTGRGGRLALCTAAALAATAAGWVAPPPETAPPARALPPPAPPAAPAARFHRPPPPPAPAAAPQASLGSGLSVTQWGFRSGGGRAVPAGGTAPAGRPLTLWFTLDGTQAAIDRLRARGAIAIEVRWHREAAGGAPGAPDLTTRLTVGQGGLADSFAAEVRRAGFFVWHGWAEKSALSPGNWTVSLTYADGRPLVCGDPPAPCRFHLTVG